MDFSSSGRGVFAGLSGDGSNGVILLAEDDAAAVLSPLPLTSIAASISSDGGSSSSSNVPIAPAPASAAPPQPPAPTASAAAAAASRSSSTSKPPVSGKAQRGSPCIVCGAVTMRTSPLYYNPVTAAKRTVSMLPMDGDIIVRKATCRKHYDWGRRHRAHERCKRGRPTKRCGKVVDALSAQGLRVIMDLAIVAAAEAAHARGGPASSTTTTTTTMHNNSGGSVGSRSPAAAPNAAATTTYHHHHIHIHHGQPHQVAAASAAFSAPAAEYRQRGEQHEGVTGLSAIVMPQSNYRYQQQHHQHHDGSAGYSSPHSLPVPTVSPTAQSAAPAPGSRSPSLATHMSHESSMSATSGVTSAASVTQGQQQHHHAAAAAAHAITAAAAASLAGTPTAPQLSHMAIGDGHTPQTPASTYFEEEGDFDFADLADPELDDLPWLATMDYANDYASDGDDAMLGGAAAMATNVTAAVTAAAASAVVTAASASASGGAGAGAGAAAVSTASTAASSLAEASPVATSMDWALIADRFGSNMSSSASLVTGDGVFDVAAGGAVQGQIWTEPTTAATAAATSAQQQHRAANRARSQRGTKRSVASVEHASIGLGVGDTAAYVGGLLTNTSTKRQRRTGPSAQSAGMEVDDDLALLLACADDGLGFPNSTSKSIDAPTAASPHTASSPTGDGGGEHGAAALPALAAELQLRPTLMYIDSEGVERVAPWIEAAQACAVPAGAACRLVVAVSKRRRTAHLERLGLRMELHAARVTKSEDATSAIIVPLTKAAASGPASASAAPLRLIGARPCTVDTVAFRAPRGAALAAHPGAARLAQVVLVVAPLRLARALPALPPAQDGSEDATDAAAMRAGAASEATTTNGTAVTMATPVEVEGSGRVAASAGSSSSRSEEAGDSTGVGTGTTQGNGETPEAAATAAAHASTSSSSSSKKPQEVAAVAAPPAAALAAVARRLMVQRLRVICVEPRV